MDWTRFGDGEVASVMSRFDWESSPLGPPHAWPQALQTIVDLMLNSKFPMFLVWGEDLGLLYNDAYAEILAHKHPAAIGQPFHEVWSELWEDIRPIVERAMMGESSYFENLPLTTRRKGYEEAAWFTFSYSPVHDGGGEVAGMYCACTETTRQVLAEQDRIDENERLTQLFQQAPGIIAVLRHSNHVFELANEAYFQLVGHREIIGKPVREALPELEGQGLFDLLDQVYSTGETYVGRAVSVNLRRQQDGALEEHFIDFVYQPIRGRTGRVTGIFVEGSDVTDAVNTTRALRESEQRLRQLANTIPHLAWMADPNGDVHWYNDRWYEYTGSRLEDMQGWGWETVYESERLPEVRKAYRRSLDTGEPFEVTAPIRSATGEYRMFYSRAAPLRDSAGNIVQWFGTNTDIQEMQEAEEELRAASRRKDEFLAMLAHELRNPLAPISTAAELLDVADFDQEMVRSTSNIIRRQVTHMTGLVDDLLDVSRVTRGLVEIQKAPIDLRTVVEDATEQVRGVIKAKRQALNFQTPDRSVLVSGDQTRLTQIFSNILNNAARYTPEHGSITIEFEVKEREVAVTVADTGVGIGPDLLPHIFELFTQAERSPDRSQGGLGLGLALAQSLALLHDGEITADSAGHNKGSRFIVRLPLLAKDASATRSSQQVDTPNSTGTPLSVMIVDDNADAANTLAMLLKYQGYDVQSEHSALDTLDRLPDPAPQAMILDIGLPDLDGYELCRRLKVRPRLARTTFIALTGYGQDQDRLRSESAGFDHHLVKPVDPAELFAILADVGAGG